MAESSFVPHEVSARRNTERALSVRVVIAIVLMLALAFFSSSPAVSQEGPQPPDWFDECDTEKFNKLSPEHKQDIDKQPTRRGKRDALRQLTVAQDIECGDNNEEKNPPSDIAEEENPEQQRQEIDEAQEDNQGQTEDQEQSDQEYQEEGTLEEDNNGGLIIGMFTSIISFISEKVGEAGAEQAAGFLTGNAFSLPTPDGELRIMYERVSDIMKPGAVLLLLITGLLMTLRGANYNTAYATQSALPKIVLFIAGLAFFPQLMNMLSTWSEAFADAVLGSSELDGGFEKLISNFFTPGATLFAGIIFFFTTFLLIGLVAVTALKSFLFGVLFIVGPLAMFLYPISNFSGIASAWFKGVIACFVIPILWVIEMRIGMLFIDSPEILLGDMPGLGLYSGIMVAMLTYAMLKTPFMVLQYCFYGNTGGGGIVGKVGTAILVKSLLGGKGKGGDD